jgi:hypothetical protein
MGLLRGVRAGTVLTVVAAATFAGACAAQAPPAPAEAALTGTTTLAVPERANAHVSVAAHGLFVIAVWAASEAGGATDIYATTSADGGATFSSPVRVSGDAHRAHASGEQPPRVAVVPRPGRAPSVVVAWITRNDAGTALVTARSDDAGATFGQVEVIAGSVAAGNRGWQAIAAGADDQLAVAWLDHRRLADEERAVGPEHQHGAGAVNAGADVDAASVAMAQLSQLYFARIDGGNLPRPLTGGVCYCCKTTMGISADGAISIAWRHVYDGNMRDIAFMRSPDGGRTFPAPVRVSEDRWSVAGCPDDGPVLAIDGRDRVHVVWPTVVTEDGEARKVLFHAMSSDGAVFTTRVRIPTEGHANHPQLAVSGHGQLAVIWDEALGGARRIRSARGFVDAAGRTTFARETAPADVEGVYPGIAFTADGGLLRAWTSGAPQSSVIRVMRTPGVESRMASTRPVRD